MLRYQTIIAVLCLFIPIGYNYNQEWPQTLETPLRQPPYNFTSMEYNLIFVATMLPVAIFSIPLGMLIDRMPLKLSCIVIIGGQCLAQTSMAILFFFSFNGFYYTILIMRMIFGLFSQPVYTLASVIAQRSISKKHIDFVLSLIWTIPMIFQAFNSFVSTAVYESTHKIYLPLFIGAGVSLLSLICCYIAVQQSQSVIKNKNDASNLQNQEQQQQQKFNIKDIKLFDRSFWIYILTVFIGNCSMSPYLDNLNDMLVERFGIQYAKSGLIVMIPMALCPFVSFIWIWITNKFPRQKRLMFVIMSIATVFTHLIILLIPNSKYPSAITFLLVSTAFVMFAIGYSGFLGLVAPNTTILVPKNLIGTAYGCVGMTFALSMTIMPIFNGLITSINPDLSKSYLYLQYIYLPISCVYLLLMIYIHQSKSQTLLKLDIERKQIQQLDKSLMTFQK